MTPTPEQLELARRDMDAIRHLRADRHFNDYFMRRIRGLRDAANVAAIHGPSSIVREESRVLCAGLEMLEGIMAKDEAECRKMIEQVAKPEAPITSRPPSLMHR